MGLEMQDRCEDMDADMGCEVRNEAKNITPKYEDPFWLHRVPNFPTSWGWLCFK